MLTPTQLLCRVAVGPDNVALNPDAVVVVSEDAETLPLSMAEKSKEANRRKDGAARRREASSVGRTSATDAGKAPGTGARRNERERNRVRQVNAGFDRLRDHVPQGRRNRRLSKVDTLRAAVDYIGHLQRILQMQCVADVDDGYFLVGGSCGSPATSESNSTSSSSNCHQSNLDSDKQQVVSDEFFRDINFNSVTKYDLSATNDLKELFPVNSGPTTAATAGVSNGAPFVNSQLTLPSGENCGSQLAISMTDLLIQIAASEKMLSVGRPATESSSSNTSAFTSVIKNSSDFAQTAATSNPLLTASVDVKPSAVAMAPTDSGIGEMYYNLRMASSCPQLQTNAGLQFNILDVLTSSQNCYTATGSSSTSSVSGTDLGAISSSLMSNVDDGLVDVNYWFRDTSCQLG